MLRIPHGKASAKNLGIFAYPPEKVYSREISKDYLRPYSDA